MPASSSHPRQYASYLRRGALVAMYGATAAQLAMLRRPMTCNQACCALIVDPRRADFRYVFYQLFNARHQLKSMANGAAQQNLSGATIRQLAFPFPPLSEQKAIAHVLGTLDDKIELNRRMNETLLNLAAAISEGEDVSETVLSDVATLERQAVQPADEPDKMFDLLSLPAFDQGAQPKRVPGHVIRSAKLVVPSDAVLLSKLNPHISRAWLPDLTKMSAPIASTEWLVLRPCGPWRHVLFSRVSGERFRRSLASRVTGTTGSHQRVRPGDVMSIPLPWPKEPAALDAALAPLYGLAAANRRESETLAALRDTLLPELVSGRLRVKEAETGVGVPA